MIKSNKLVHGIGFKGMDYPSYDGEKMLKEYDLWKSMLLRCTNKYWIKKPTYAGVTCSENFKSYTFFYEWCQEQVGFKNVDEKGNYWQLDKDLLIKGNKVYSEDVCVFVPQRLNSLLIKYDAKRGDYPIGVSWCEKRGKFQTGCRDNFGVARNLGRYYTVEESFQAYKKFKEATIKQAANDYKEVLDVRVYQALMQYTVEITD
jgi:hypothetical protein